MGWMENGVRFQYCSFRAIWRMIAQLLHGSADGQTPVCGASSTNSAVPDRALVGINTPSRTGAES